MAWGLPTYTEARGRGPTRLLREALSHTLLAPEQLGGPWGPWPARAWGRLRQRPSLGPLLPLALARPGRAHTVLLEPRSPCSWGADSAVAGPRW